jgi:gluconolactonase
MGWADPNLTELAATRGGDLIGGVCLPATCADPRFGGPRRNRLFVAACTAIDAAYVETWGAVMP